MRIGYFADEVRLKVDDIQSSRLDLHTLFRNYVKTLSGLDYDDMVELIKQENSKSSKQSWIKDLHAGKYEFRIPPVNKNGVLRVEFELEDYSDKLIITDAYVKSNQPKVSHVKKGSKK